MKIAIAARTSTTKTTRRVHLRIDFMCLNRVKAFEQQPKADSQLEQRHRRVEDVVVNDFVELRENEVGESAEDAPGRTNYTEDCQSPRNVVRLEPQPGADSRGQAEEWQADIIIIE